MAGEPGDSRKPGASPVGFISFNMPFIVNEGFCVVYNFRIVLVLRCLFLSPVSTDATMPRPWGVMDRQYEKLPTLGPDGRRQGCGKTVRQELALAAAKAHPVTRGVGPDRGGAALAGGLWRRDLAMCARRYKELIA